MLLEPQDTQEQRVQEGMDPEFEIATLLGRFRNEATDGAKGHERRNERRHEVADRADLEAGSLELGPELRTPISSPMAGKAIHFVEEERMRRNRENENPSRSENRRSPGEDRLVVIDVL